MMVHNIESRPPVPSGRLLAVDYGSVRIGLAISDRDRLIASPLATLTRTTEARDRAFFEALVAQEAVVAIVVGLPLHLNGKEGQKAQESRKFAQWLHQVTGLPIYFTDERFTTVEAESTLWKARLTHRQRQERRDRLAAQMILQTYLELGCPAEFASTPLDAP